MDYEKTLKEIEDFILYKAGHLVDEETEHRFIKFLEKQKGFLADNSKTSDGEDERIRKIIRLALIASEEELSDFYKVHKISRKECTDWLDKKQKEQKPVDYEAELKKCKDNPLYFYDKYVKIKMKEQKPMEKKSDITDIIDNKWRECLPKDEGMGLESATIVNEQFDAIARYFYNLGSQKEKEQEQKPAEWSEEDEKQIRQIERIVKNWASPKLQEKIHNFLSSLRPQPKQEWSEEDGAKLGALINYFEGDALDYSTDDIVDWLKSLRPQPNYNDEIPPHWRPSEEQMDSLHNAIVHCKGYYDTVYLPELYEELKQL